MKHIDIRRPFFDTLDSIDPEALAKKLSIPAPLNSADLENPDFDGLLRLLAPKTAAELEKMAFAAIDITRRRFGRVVGLYAPMYISNECINSCVYCGFRTGAGVRRGSISIEEALVEAEMLHQRGFRHILLVSGESQIAAPPERLIELTAKIKKTFPSVTLEVYPLGRAEYAALVAAGMDGLTLYQETYNQKLYADYHPAGPKRNFANRLEAIERAGDAGAAKLNIGALFGLAEWRSDAALLGLHALYLSRRFWKATIAVSAPRLRQAAGGIIPPYPVSDLDLAHMLIALRIFLPDSPLVLSTREPADLRDRMAKICVTIMSAGSRTEPGGYSKPEECEKQFEISDHRTPSEVAAALRKSGLDPVWKDWERAII